MVATKLRAIAWTQRRRFHAPQFTPATPGSAPEDGSKFPATNIHVKLSMGSIVGDFKIHVVQLYDDGKDVVDYATSPQLLVPCVMF